MENILVNDYINRFEDVELKDDESPFGGVSFHGETLSMFLAESFRDSEIEAMTMEELNHILSDCGIARITF